MHHHDLNARFLDEYKKNFFNLENAIDNISSEKQKRLDDEICMKYRSELLILSVIYNLIFFLFQIIFFKTENYWSKIVVFTIGLFSSCLTVSVICLVLIKRKCLKINFNILTFFSYFSSFLDIFIVSLLSDFSNRDSDFYAYNIYVYDFNLVLTGCLVIISCEFTFMMRHRYKIISYFIAIIGLILFRTISAKEFLKFLYFTSLSVFMFFICFWVKKKNISKKNPTENSTDTQKVFNHFNSVSRALGVGIFLFRSEELFFANDVARDIIETVPMMPLNQISNANNHSLKEIKPSIGDVDIKVSMSDSKICINRLSEDVGIPYQSPNDESDLKQKKEVKLLFKNLSLFEDISNISETVSHFKRKKIISEQEGKLDNISLINIFDDKETRVNLYSVFNYLSHADNNSLSKFNEYSKIGIFEFQLNGGKKTYYKIMVKAHVISSSNKQAEKVIEFIFEDVTSHYDFLIKIEEHSLQFKKNAHELKTPILSLLGCVEELKSRLDLNEGLLPESEKKIINNYLEHMTNLGSYTGYLIKGLTKNRKEINSAEENRKIKLNSLLSFSFSILQTLLSCDHQKSKQVQTELINDIIDYDVSFDSNEIQVKQIILNFISNSVKFTNYGSIVMEAKLKKGIQNNTLKIIIKDTGCGIKKEDNLKLFQEYAKFDNTENNAYGTGLGLNICKSIADKLNMKIKFKSEENKGTKVCLYIFNPVINEKESRINIAPRITDYVVDLPKITSVKSASDNRTNNIQSRNIHEEELNLEDIMVHSFRKEETIKIYSNSSKLITIHKKEASYRSDEESNKTFVLLNQVNSGNNTSLFSLNSPESSETFNIDANNMKSTKRLDIDHIYWQAYSQRYLPREILPKQKLKKKLNKSSQNLKSQVFSLNYSPQSLQIPATLDVIKKDNRSSFRTKEIKMGLEKSLNRAITINLKTIPSLEAAKILIVDDQFHARRPLVNMINKYCTEQGINYDVIEECDGIGCLNTIIKNPFNIRYIFIDENMNYMNGTETAEIIWRLTNLGKIGKINMIFTTADDQISYKKDQFDFCITKPLMMQNIQDVFQHVGNDIIY